MGLTSLFCMVFRIFANKRASNWRPWSKIFTLLRSLYRYIIVDLSHWLDEFFLQVVMEADMVLMLTGLTVPDLRNLKRLWPALLEWYPERRKIKLVVNRFDRGNGLQLKDLEQMLQQNVFATLPSDYYAMMEALNRGAPLGLTAPRSKLWKGMKTLAEQVMRELPGGARRTGPGSLHRSGNSGFLRE